RLTLGVGPRHIDSLVRAVTEEARDLFPEKIVDSHSKRSLRASSSLGACVGERRLAKSKALEWLRCIASAENFVNRFAMSGQRDIGVDRERRTQIGVAELGVEDEHGEAGFDADFSERPRFADGFGRQVAALASENDGAARLQSEISAVEHQGVARDHI